MEKIKRILEAVLFISGKPISKEEIKEKLKFKGEEIEKAIEELIKEYKDSAIEISKTNGKYVMQIRREYADYVKKFAPMELSKSLLKTLAIIAYHQPIKQSNLKKIIGSQVYEHIKELRKKGFLNLKKEGRTKIVKLSQYFYDYFGFEKDKIKDILYKRLIGKNKNGKES